MITVWVLTLVLFLQGGIVVTKSAPALDAESCEAARPDIEAQWQGKTVKVGDEDKVVLDAQTLPCEKVVQNDHA